MASKKLKKAIMAGLAGYAGAKMLGSKTSTANVKTEGGDKCKSATSLKKQNQHKTFSFSGGKNLNLKAVLARKRKRF
jgi:hypothetical protein